MVCLVCGNRTSAGASLCSRCFKRVEDPLGTLGLAIDPMADMRFRANDSVVLRIGPSFVGEVRLSKGLDPSVTFDRMINGPDRSHVPSFIDEYLSDLGVGLELTGNEMVPSRQTISSMIRSSWELDFDSDTWGKACLRMGNVVSLAVRRCAVLPLEPSDSAQLISELREMAVKLYTNAMNHAVLESIAKRNMETFENWAVPEAVQ